MKLTVISVFILIIFTACTKKVGKNPDLFYSDKALLDSCKATHPYYKNDPPAFYSGAHGPHGRFKLRFNKIALQALTDNGKLPVGAKMPEGSMIIKDVYSGAEVSLYAFMYKRSGNWLWAEVKPGGEVLYSVNKNPETCTSCHGQSGNRDLVRSFQFY